MIGRPLSRATRPRSPAAAQAHRYGTAYAYPTGRRWRRWEVAQRPPGPSSPSGRWLMPSVQDIETPARRAARGASNELGGFKKFLLRGNVVDLAVGIVVGAAFGNIVQALVKDII